LSAVPGTDKDDFRHKAIDSFVQFLVAKVPATTTNNEK
jgi:hypothetical protein